ncbi:hypothetical protein ABZS52_31240 [Micromonospora profundi]|uniref:hypothetical protein n=1 Tax=Micromonospora profundi TaxID=1420889 RepID=UPI0033AE888E
MNLYSLDPDKGHLNQSIRDALGLDDTEKLGHWIVAAQDQDQALRLLRDRGFPSVTAEDLAAERTVNDLRSAGLLDRECVLVRRLISWDGDAVAAVEVGGVSRRLGVMRGGRFVPNADN